MEPDVKIEAKIKGLVYDPDRHGNDRYYFRRRGQPKIRIHSPYGSPEFREEVRCAELGIAFLGLIKPTPQPQRTSPMAKPGSLKWLCLEYLRRGRGDWDDDTFARKQKLLSKMCEGATLSASGILNGDLSFSGMQLKHVAQLRDKKLAAPDSANRLVKNLSAMFNWAIGAGIAQHNPAEKCAKLTNPKRKGFHSWTLDEIATFQKRHPAGTKAHLWLLILLFTGLRKTDAATLGRFHVRTVNGERRIVITPGKTTKSSQVVVDIPLLPPLAEALDALPASQVAFMCTAAGKPHSSGTMGNYMREWCDQAELPHCSSHGLRKAGAVIAAENGATSAQLQALFGWTTSQQADRYTKAASRQKLATAGAKLLTLNDER